MKRFTGISAIIFFLACGGQAFGQATISSPYSDFGVGLIEPGTFALGKGMGGISQGIRTPVDINITNPASYTGIRLTTFEAGLFGGIRGLSTDGQQQTNHDFGLSYLSLAFPVSKKWGSSVGLLPFSNVGYRVVNSGAPLDTTNVNYISLGEGGLSQFYIGNSFAFSPNFSVGANVAYLFGNIEQSRATEYPEDQLFFRNSKIVNAFKAHGFRFSFGFQGGAKLADEVRLTFGYTGTLSSNLQARSDLYYLSYTLNQGIEDAVDTTGSEIGVDRTISLPASHEAGFAIASHNRWLFGADVSYSDWSGFKRESGDAPLEKSLGFSAGLQFTPDPDAVSNYFRLINYRAGFSYRKMPLNINGQSIKQTVFSVGLGMPFLSREMNSFGKFNLGVEFGQRGSDTNNLVKEQFAMFNVGITYSTRWFIKRQFN